MGMQKDTKEDDQDTIKSRVLMLMKKGFKFGKREYINRADLHER